MTIERFILSALLAAFACGYLLCYAVDHYRRQ